MPCCGQNRRAATSSPAYPSPRPERPASPNPVPATVKTVPGRTVAIHNKRPVLVEVQGPATGQRYRFEAGGTQAVDKRDADHFIATGMFGRAWS